MMDMRAIHALNHDIALEAAKNKRVPFFVTKQDLATYRAHGVAGLNIPNLGDYLPATWARVNLATAWGSRRGLDEDMNALFVDKSGVGRPGEPALTLDEFLEALRPGYGYAIVEEGQFQVYVGVFEHPKRAA